MKKIILLIFSVIAVMSSYAGIDMTAADKLFDNPDECEKELLTQLSNAENGIEKCEVLWRLSEVYLLKGEKFTSKEEKRPYYTKGKQYAEEAIKADPKNPHAYMWHSANVGRESQTKGLKEQIAIVSIVTDDLTMIVDNLKVLDMSEAWQALSEMYFKHPFKSNDSAINYARKAIMCIPSNEARLSSYAYFAEILYDRGNSATKRKELIDEYAQKFNKSYKTNIDKFSYFEGSLGSSYVPKWSAKSLGNMSDKEEAVEIINYALNLYKTIPVKTKQDNIDYKILVSYKEKWK